MYHVLNTEPLIPSILNKDNNDRTSGCGLVVFSWGFSCRGGYKGGGHSPPWDFEAKNVPNLINVIVNDKFRIRNL